MVTMTESDEQLVLNIQDGDERAFATLVNRHCTRFYHLAFRYMQNREDAEDIVQQAFLKFWERPTMWNAQKKTKFTTWFYRLIVNACLDAHKKHKSLPLHEEIEIQDTQQSQEHMMQENEEKSALKEAVSNLPKRQKTALILCAFEELSHKEAAKVMKINIKALQSLLMRAKQHLKQTLPLKGAR